MARWQILSPAEAAAFDAPPVFTSVERKRFFDLSQRLEDLLHPLRTPANQIGFVLALGYFRATKRFFALQYHEEDAHYVTGQLGVLPGMVNLDRYDEATARRHRKLILDYLGYQVFDAHAERALRQEIHPLVRSQVRPKILFLHCLDVLARSKTEIPTARTLTDLIVGEITTHKRTLTVVIDEQVVPELRELLDTVLQKADVPDGPIPQIQRFKLTLLKKISQSTRPSRIKETMEDWRTLLPLYDQLAPIITALDLTHEGLRYYANVVLKAQVFQVSRREEADRHLHLLCFIAHQFYRLQDTLTDVVLTVVQTVLNTCRRVHKERYYEARLDYRQAMRQFAECVEHGALRPLTTIETLAFRPDLTAQEKVERIQAVFTTDRQPRVEAQAQLATFHTQVQRDARDADYYEVLSQQSRRLQNRLADILKVMPFAGDETSPLMAALQYYRAKDGVILQSAPVDFLDEQEQQVIRDADGAIRVSLYKALLYVKVAEAIKGGALNLRHSYKYRSLDDYLIPKQEWQAKRVTYLQRADLTAVADWQSTLTTLAHQLDQQYQETNQHLLAGANPYLRFRKDGSYLVNTPKAEPEDSEPLLSVLPKRRYISLLEVLATVERFTHFVAAFVPWRMKYTRPKPPARTFYAGIIGYGCFIGTHKIASISSGVAESELETTVNSYFTLDNLHSANDRILQFMDQLALPALYRQPNGLLHTSSDGQKFEVAVDSLHASYSFKYFGHDKGVSAYTFLDMRHFLFHSLVISAAEHEAHYVIDGLMHNEVVKSDIHSTDTGGYSEVLFGVMHLLGFAFAPRIKNFAHRDLYAFEKRKHYQASAYKILPDGVIRPGMIAPQWEDILRFVATIKLKEATASQLFKRLNSYARQHPLYVALKEFGRIPKSDFLLRYIDTVELRQLVEKQLNKGESVHKFSRAISFGNNQEFLYGEKLEQEIAEACRRLIKNAIICWNYLYLSQQIADAESEERQQELVTALRNGSVVTWQHVNLHGEYDFSDEKLRDSVGLEPPPIALFNKG